jgi:PIN domain nuclease of toxin-antitoxin system
MPTLLDTHAWMWWVNEDSRLSRKARTTIEQAQSKDDLWLSLISVWEVAKKVEKGQVALDRAIDQWLDEATIVQGLHLWELTRPILVQSCSLPQPFHGDPADQIIVSTARHHEAPLITKDKKIRDYPHVRTIW